jgi:hypothetical protein
MNGHPEQLSFHFKLLLMLCLILISTLGYSQKTNQLSGKWIGTYICPQGETGLLLEIKYQSNSLFAIFNFYPVRSNPNIPSGSFSMSVSLEKNNLSLTPLEWIVKPSGYTMTGFSLIWNKNTDCLQGIICNNPVTLTRLTALLTPQDTTNKYMLPTHTSSVQLTPGSQRIPKAYDRTSLTVFYIDLSGRYAERAKKMIQQLEFSAKYNNLNLSSLIYKPSFTISTNTNNNSIHIRNDLNQKSLGKEIVSKWYNRQTSGKMDVSFVHKSGRFSATDEDYLFAQSTRRGNVLLDDYGQRLVNLSYILIIDIQNLKNTNDNEQVGWKADVVGYIYKINYSEIVQDLLYACWIDDNDTEAQIVQKNNFFSSIFVPITHVLTIIIGESETSYPKITASTQENIEKHSKLWEDVMLFKLIKNSYEDIILIAERHIDDFKINIPLFTVRPLSAKIGKKEGLKVDNRFFVYEHVEVKGTNMVEAKLRGVVRATSRIADNQHEATGNMQTSKFYQVAGRRLKPGFSLQQKNDIGLESTVGWEHGEVGGIVLRADLRSSKEVSLRAFFTYLELAFQLKKYSNNATSQIGISNQNFSFFHLGLGIAKGFQPMRNVELRPHTGIGFEYTLNEDLPTEASVGAIYLRPGINVSINLRHDFQILGGTAYYLMFGYVLDENKKEMVPWKQLFEDRGGPSYFVGVKKMF